MALWRLARVRVVALDYGSWVSIAATQLERIARAVHEQYLREQTRDGVAMGSAPGMTDWEHLDEDKREANRAQARDIEAKLGRIGCQVAPATEAQFTFTDAELEALARDEQVRWSRERTEAGWRHGDPRDDAAKLHPSLVTWDELSESEKDKDRDAVRNIPAALASVGLGIVRRSPVR